MLGSPDNLSADMTSPTFAIVAGEASGDTLGADLIRALKRLFPSASFEGIGGPKMIAEGFVSHHQMDRLSVMGFVEPFKRLPELLSIRRDIIRRYKQTRPAAFIGIDSPDFNLGIEKALHQDGVKTVHYVSPSVWAWRQGRIKGIKRSVDLMLTLLPFEESFYQQHAVPVSFVGHPLAGQISRTPDSAAARQQLGLDTDSPLLTIMPGSRGGEVALMGELFLMVAERLLESNPQLQFLIPAANGDRHKQLTEILEEYPQLPVTLVERQSLLAMEAADAVLLASGTTALEAMLLQKPMVVSYKLGNLTYKLVRPFIKTPFASIPNLLAGEMLVPELIQDEATVESLSAAVTNALDENARELVKQRFNQLYEQINLPSGDTAAAAISKLISQ
jgi:lipid-A-disaccharide synthase